MQHPRRRRCIPCCLLLSGAAGAAPHTRHRAGARGGRGHGAQLAALPARWRVGDRCRRPFSWHASPGARRWQVCAALEDSSPLASYNHALNIWARRVQCVPALLLMCASRKESSGHTTRRISPSHSSFEGKSSATASPPQLHGRTICYTVLPWLRLVGYPSILYSTPI